MTMIQTVTTDQLYKAYQVTTYIPAAEVANVINGILKVWAAKFGNYEHVIWSSSVGKEYFKPLSGAVPKMGSVGQSERIDSVAVNFFIPKNKALLLNIINNGIYPSHPWETPVIKAVKCLIPQNLEHSLKN